MSSLAERTKISREKIELSQQQLADKVGVSQQSIAKIENGETLQPRKIKQLADTLGVTVNWLQFGVGEPTGTGKVNRMVSKTKHDVYRIDVLDLTVSAGPGTYMLSDNIEVLYAIEFTTDHARTLLGNREPEEVKVMTVNGDSMAPTLNSGDRLFVDVTVRSFKTDGIYAFVFDKTFHVKRLQMQGSRLAVLSDNPGYEKWYIDEDTQDQLYVMGKALIHESIKYNKL